MGIFDIKKNKTGMHNLLHMEFLSTLKCVLLDIKKWQRPFKNNVLMYKCRRYIQLQKIYVIHLSIPLHAYMTDKNFSCSSCS